jgi:hypothetical protein
MLCQKAKIKIVLLKPKDKPQWPILMKTLSLLPIEKE